MKHLLTFEQFIEERQFIDLLEQMQVFENIAQKRNN